MRHTTGTGVSQPRREGNPKAEGPPKSEGRRPKPERNPKSEARMEVRIFIRLNTAIQTAKYPKYANLLCHCRIDFPCIPRIPRLTVFPFWLRLCRLAYLSALAAVSSIASQLLAETPGALFGFRISAFFRPSDFGLRPWKRGASTLEH